MGVLDLFEADSAQQAKIQPNEGAYLPSTFEENFKAAWNDGRYFNQSIARANARASVLDDYVNEIKQKTGNDLRKEFFPDAAGGGQTGVTDFTTANERVAKIKESYPDLDLEPLSEEEIDKRAVAKAQIAHQTYEGLQQREKTAGGKFGTVLGDLAAGAADPINIVGLPFAPETAGVGILSAALKWGALAGVSQGAISFAGDQFREQVQPGYIESGAPGREILGAAVGGAVLGGGIKALGNAWTRVATGKWPRSVRDAGNLIGSEANIQETNILPGVEGETANRDAMGKATGDILAGRPVDVSHIITPDLLDRSRALVERLQAEEPMRLPVINQRAIELAAEQQRLSARDAELAAHVETLPKGDLSAADRLNRLQAVEQQIAEATEPAAKRKLNERRDQILVDTTPEKLQAAAAPIEARRAAEAERASIAARLDQITAEHANLQASTLPQMQLPALGQRERIPTGPRGQFEMDLKSPAAAAAPPVAPGAPARPQPMTAGAIAGELDRLHAAVTAPEAPAAPEKALPPERSTVMPDRAVERQPLTLTPEQMQKVLDSSELQTAIRADIDRARAMGDIKFPEVDENGNKTMLSVDKEMETADAYKKLADEMQACINPAKEAAE